MGTAIFLLHHYSGRQRKSSEQSFMEIVRRPLQVRRRKNRYCIGPSYDSNSSKSGSLCFKDKSNTYHFSKYIGIYFEPAYSRCFCGVDDGRWLGAENPWIRFCL